VIRRGEIRWVDLGEPHGSEPGYRRPVVVVQVDAFNRSRIATVVVIVLTSNLLLARAPGNVLLPKAATGLAKDSVANVSQILTLDRADLDSEVVWRLSPSDLDDLADGLRLVLSLEE
jgi:mRNA interferase MazF